MPPSRKKVFPQPDADLLSKTHLRNTSELLNFLVACQKRLGDYVLIDGVAGLRMYFLTDPSAVHHVFFTARDNYVKPAAYAQEMERLMGGGLLTSEGQDWLRQRRISQPIFQAQHMPPLLPVASSCTANLLASWQSVASDEWIDFYKEMLHLTNAIAIELMFGSDTDDEGLILKTQLAETLFRLKMLGRDSRDENSPIQAAHHVDRFHDLVIKLIDRRRQGINSGEDLLAYYVAVTQDFAQTGFTEQELLDEVKTLTMGGHHNVASALSWTFYLLALNNDVQHKLLQELDATTTTARRSIAELGKLEYLRAVLQESMRLYPPVWGTTRESVGDDCINGYQIPAGSMVFLSQWITHRHPQFWPQPERFDPDRFSSARAERTHKCAYFPFGRGPRQCIAQDMSFMLMLLIASELGRRFRFELPEKWSAEIDPAFVLAPAGGLPVRLHARD